ncbi:MAG: sigma-70 family RNA polymerase sigma factor [Myxococcota bacterium]
METASTSSDEELMLAYREGDAQALRELFSRYAGPLTRAVTRMLRDEERSRDVVQQTFLQVHRARADFDRSRSFRPWLYTIGLNLARDELRRRGRRPEESLEYEPAGDEPTQEQAVQRSENRARLEAALAELSAEQREVVVLHWFEGLSFAEIATTTGAGLSAVKVRAHRAYKKMRQLLESGGVTG